MPDPKTPFDGLKHLIPGSTLQARIRGKHGLSANVLCLGGDWGYVVLSEGRFGKCARFDPDWEDRDARANAEAALEAAEADYADEHPEA